jgi:hypothetical protein
VADDICLVDTRSEGPAVVIPAAPWLKLWTEPLQHLGWPAVGLEQVFSDEEKYRFPLSRSPLSGTALENPSERHRIGTLVFLDRPTSSQNRAAAEIRGVTPAHALPMLMNLTHQSFLLDAMGKREQNFRDCAKVASQASAYRLVRPWGFEHMESAIDSIESLLGRI